MSASSTEQESAQTTVLIGILATTVILLGLLLTLAYTLVFLL
ncbi:MULTISPECIES: hypothetical protein [Plantibacter]|nr:MULTISPECIES: hypothetical protein [Plantibacter]